jgi:DNA-binding transcriptional regulator GbsR (MarR family)
MLPSAGLSPAPLVLIAKWRGRHFGLGFFSCVIQFLCHSLLVSFRAQRRIPALSWNPSIDRILNPQYFHDIVKVPKQETSRARFVERFASVLTESGFPRMPARVFAALLATDSGRLTAAELAALLHVSAAAISGAVSYLVQVNLASREAEPGSRREHYRVHNETWYEAIARKDQVLDRCERSLREGIEVVGRDTPAGARIAETLAFFEFIQTELPAMLERWRVRKAELGVANSKRTALSARSKSSRAA